MTRLACRGARRHLTAFCDGELPVAQQIQVEQHLRECAACQLEADAIRALGAALREHAVDVGAAAADDLVGLQSSVVSRLKAETAQSFGVRVRELFDDMHFVWTGLSAVGAAAACVVVVMGMFYFGWKVEKRDSLAAVLSTVAPPPAAINQPAGVEGRQIAWQQPGDAASTMLINSEEDAVFALAATVVTSHGRIGEPGPVSRRLLDELSRARFETRTGSPMAVNMVWLIAHTTVRGKSHLPPKIGIRRGEAPAVILV